jgi:rsbT co-antagonist protein RsbR
MATVDLLSTPILEVWGEVIALPLIGTLDERRSALIMQKLLDMVARLGSRFVIIDLTGIAAMDATVADRLLTVARSLELLGARCILTGISPSVAETLVSIGAHFRGVVTLRSVKDGLRACMMGTRGVLDRPRTWRLR